MSDSHQFGLDALGQRVQAMADPVPADRPRGFGGAPQAAAAPMRPAAGYEPTPFRVSPQQQETVMPIPEKEHATQYAQAAASASASAAAASAASAAEAATRAAAALREESEPRNGVARAISAVKAALPFMQKLLPLLDGNVMTAVGSILAPIVQNSVSRQAPPPVKVNLEPIERSLSELREGQREFRNHLADQVTAIKRVEDQLEHVREATDRNTLEQQEMMEDLRAVGSRLGTLATIGVLFLALSLGLNVYLLVQMQHLLR